MSRVTVGLLIGLVFLSSQTGSMQVAGDARVVRAAKVNNVAAVRALIRQRADVNGRDGDGATALIWATHWQANDIVRELLAAGANPKLANRLGMTPLLVASRLGNAPVIEMLLKAGVPADEKHLDGETALMAAAGAGSVEGVRMLVAAGAAVDSKDEWQGETALMWAAAEGHADVTAVLVEAGAALNIVGTPSALPHYGGGFAGGRGFTDHASRGLTAVMLAAREGHTDVVRRLVDAGADLKHANPDQVTALMIAIINSRFDLAAVLLDRGANPDDGSLYEAVEMHNLAPIVTTGDATRPRLMHENTLTALDLIGRLLEKGANPNKMFTGELHFGAPTRAPSSNASPLVRAAQLNDVAAIRLMMAKGGDANRPDPPVPGAPPIGGGGFGRTGGGSPGMTPLMISAGGGAAGGRGFGGGGRAGGPQFREPGVRNALASATAMLDAPGTNVNSQGGTGDTALHRAAQTGNVQMIQLLADRGAKFDIRNGAGFTPLDIASGAGAPPAAAPGPGGGGGRGGGAGGPQPAAIALLRKLMNLPPLAEGEMPRVAPAPPAPLGN